MRRESESRVEVSISNAGKYLWREGNEPSGELKAREKALEVGLCPTRNGRDGKPEQLGRVGGFALRQEQR